MGDNSRSFYTASPVHACFVLRDCLQRGLAPEPLFAGTQLTRAKLESGNAIIVGDFLRLLENARQYTGDETLGLMIGRHTNTAALGPVGAAAATAPTVRDGLQVMESFARLHVTYVRIALVSSLHCLSVRFRYLLPLGETERFHCETAVLFIQNYVEMLTGLTLDNAQYRFSFANPGYPQAYQRCMHSALSFDQEHTAVDIPHQWLDLR
ncbi:MAG: AraC family transcriptional regulator, partial [Gammaproteobacteria bacterium]|nr:AraC family transcriptional regulator [Gammaproteobacteria bacterium]